MARQSFAQQQIPSGVESAVYPDHRAVAALVQHGGESFMAKVVGAGGAGGSFVCPFQPALIDVYEPAGPTMMRSLRASDAAVHVNLITGAAAAANPTVTPVDANDPSQGFTVALPTALAPDGDTATVVCTGFRDVNGSL